MPASSEVHLEDNPVKLPIPEIQLPASYSSDEGNNRLSREDSIIELQTLDLTYDIQSVSSNDSDSVTVIETEQTSTSKLTRSREPAHVCSDNIETCLSVVIERNDNSDSSEGNSDNKKEDKKDGSERQTHSGIVLSPLQLGQ